MTQAIRFYSIDPRTGEEDTEYGHVWKRDDGLEYENDIVRDIMATTVGRYGEEKAFTFFGDWGNGYSCSELVDGDAQRAAGQDITPGHDELHHWWTRGPGLARWIESPHPFTTLRDQLLEHVPLEQANRMAAAWVHEVTGNWPGSDAHRVATGHKPRGERIGPG